MDEKPAADSRPAADFWVRYYLFGQRSYGGQARLCKLQTNTGHSSHRQGISETGGVGRVPDLDALSPLRSHRPASMGCNAEAEAVQEGSRLLNLLVGAINFISLLNCSLPLTQCQIEQP